MIPLKFCVSFPLVFHTLGGYRHLVRTPPECIRFLADCSQPLTHTHPLARAWLQFWDFTQRGIDNASADASSKALFAGSFAASAALALLELPPA